MILISFWLRLFLLILRVKIKKKKKKKSMKLTPSLEQKTFPLSYQSYLQKNRHILKVDIKHLASPDTYLESGYYQTSFHSVLWNTPVNLTQDNYYSQQLFTGC